MRILLTGATGTFGTSFVRWALKHGHSIVGMARNAEMRYRLSQAYPEAVVVPGDVRILSDLATIAETFGPFDLLIHAAAEKHVTTGQAFKKYAWDVNVGGAINVLEIADAYGIPKIVALSTDKACEPVNFYGETKAEAEKLFIQGGRTVVRYGNVIGSSGSVLPLFLKQRTAGRLTITDRRMTRFFMPIDDDGAWGVIQEPGRQRVMSAVGLVAYAMQHGTPGDILIPTIPSGTIQNLAEQIGPGCVIEETGIRDGEKIHEQLIATDEIPRTYRLTEGVFVVKPWPCALLEPVPSDFRYTSDVDPQPLHLEMSPVEDHVCVSPV